MEGSRYRLSARIAAYSLLGRTESETMCIAAYTFGENIALSISIIEYFLKIFYVDK